jgi:nitrogen fixation/metabolism regulation signal transduction histidine kinase
MEKERAQLRVKASDLTSFRFPIRQRFFIFTLLVSVVPLALVSRFFLEDTISRMNERTEGLLSKAAQVSQVIFISQSLPIQPSHFSADWLETHRAHFRQLAQIFPELVFRVFTVSSTNRVQLIYHSAPLALSGELPADLNQKMNGKAYLEKEPKVDWRTLLTSLQDNSGRSVGYLLVSAPNQTNLKDQYAQATSSFLFLIGLLVLLTTFSFNQSKHLKGWRKVTCASDCRSITQIKR